MKRIVTMVLFACFSAGVTVAHEAPSTSAEKKAYIAESLQLFEVEAKYIETYTDDNLPGVRYAIKNLGKETLTKITVVVYFLGKDGNPFFETEFFPVWVTDSGLRRDKPLRPNYTQRMEKNKWMTEKRLGEEWSGEVKVEIVDIEFAE